jgi:argininosuccinate lyase
MDEKPIIGAVSLRERVTSPPAQAMVDSYYASAVAAGVRFLFEPEMRIHLAHAVMIAECGIVARSDVAQILQVLLALRAAGPSALVVDYQQEDLYSYVERHLIEKLGPAVGGRLHTGRSRNDLNVTSWRLALRTRLLDLLAALVTLRAALLDLASRHSGTVMPGYTHTQHAQPITFGYYLLSAADGLGRDFRRLASALACCDRSPLGAGALSTTGFPIDRAMTRDLLGFADLVEVAYDGVSSRDDVHEAASALAVMMTGLSRVATDLQLWNTAEFGFVELADAYSSVSSIMPQKKNPQALEHIKTVAAVTVGALATALAASKNTSFSDVNDGVTGVNVPVLEAIERTTRALAVAEGVLATLTVHKEAMLRAAAAGFGTATDLADAIVRETGLSFRIAHNIVGRVVRQAVGAGRSADTITGAEVSEAARVLFGQDLAISDGEVRKALDPAENVRSRIVTGGPAPQRMAEMLENRRAQLTDDRARLAEVGDRIAAADARLERSVKELLQAHAAGRAEPRGSR